MATKLSENFTLEEMLVSSTAKKYGIDNTPDATVKANMSILCNKLLQPIRNKFGKSIIVTSGYRCLALNTRIGGSKTSQHMKGQAADINSGEGYKAGGDARYKANAELFDLIYKMGGYDQLINEFPNAKGQPQWVHVSYNPTLKKQRGQALVAKKVNGKTIYLPYKK
jgi:zinc D-Ala-D-Ala carboxypeptidase